MSEQYAVVKSIFTVHLIFIFKVLRTFVQMVFMLLGNGPWVCQYLKRVVVYLTDVVKSLFKSFSSLNIQEKGDDIRTKI